MSSDKKRKNDEHAQYTKMEVITLGHKNVAVQRVRAPTRLKL